MKRRFGLLQPTSSRREVIWAAAAGPLALTLPRRAMGRAAAQGTPVTDFGSSERELIDAQALAARAADPSRVVVALTPADEFAAGHIPRAVQVDWPALEVVDTSDESLASWRGALEQELSRLGITNDSSVVAYDGGTLFAARLWWVLQYLGHRNVSMLNGGLPAWSDAGLEVESGAHVPDLTGKMSFVGSPQPDLLATKTEVLAAIGSADVVFVDARTPDEYRKGHIPGAVNLNYPLNAEPQAPKVFRPVETLRQMYAEIGATSDRRIIPYCSSGVRSAVTMFTLAHLGYEQVALYTGSWQEWGADPDTPKATGTES